MKTRIIVLAMIALLIAGVAWATKYESTSSDAQSQAIYGHDTATSIVPVHVTTAGDAITTNEVLNATLVRKTVDFTAGQTAQAIWTPATGTSFVITDIIITASTGGVLTIFDGTDSTANRIFKGTFSDKGGFDHSYAKPIVGAAANNVLKYTSDGTCVGSITVWGYEK